MISVGVRDFTDPLVPTGMKTGVGTGPWGRWTVQARARPETPFVWWQRAGLSAVKVGEVPGATRGSMGLETPSARGYGANFRHETRFEKSTLSSSAGSSTLSDI